MNDFKPFGPVMAKVKNRKIDPAYEIHLALYQAITGPDEADKIFKSDSHRYRQRYRRLDPASGNDR